MRYLILVGLLAGCAVVPDRLKLKPRVETAPVAVETDTDVSAADQLRPKLRPFEGGAAAPKTEDVTTTAPVPSGELGTTVASLGSPAETGLWLKTPLVTTEQAGKVSFGGKTINVTLIPIEGPVTAGSRMSLQAFQDLGAPLTGLPEVSVSI